MCDCINAGDIMIEERKNFFLVTLKCDFNFSTLPGIKKHLNEAKVYISNKPVIFEISQVGFVDSDALGMLIGLSRTLIKNDVSKPQILIVTTNPQIIKIFNITGLYKIFSIFRTIEDAIKSLN